MLAEMFWSEVTVVWNKLYLKQLIKTVVEMITTCKYAFVICGRFLKYILNKFLFFFHYGVLLYDFHNK